MLVGRVGRALGADLSRRSRGSRVEASTGLDGVMPQKMNLREYIDTLRTEGYTVRGSKGEDPVLIAPDGQAVETWREDYP